MFTGIIKDIGLVSKIAKKSGFWQLGIKSAQICEEAQAGDSVAVNGVCLTVKKKVKDVFFCDAVSQTLKISNLKRLKAGSLVNLEPSLAVNQKLDGHFVLGHVDTEARLVNIRKAGDNIKISLRIPPEFNKYIVSKGSIALEGMSLTVAEFKNNIISINIIPYTWEYTNLKDKKPSSYVNVECDYLAKIVHAK